jgi:diguanylate cyclase (GGDEF)-like protein/PAS domain S-box-containing protein
MFIDNKQLDELLKSENIAIKNYLKNSDTQLIIEKYEIDEDDFNDKLTTQVFRYFIMVLSKKHTATQCPSLEVFFKYLNEKSLLTSDIIVLFSNFRNFLLTHLSKYNLISIEIINRLNNEFDKNIIPFIAEFEKKSEKQRKKIKDKQNDLLEAQKIANTGHWDFDLRTDKLSWSEEVHRIFGTNAKTFNVNYETFLEQIHPHDKSMVSLAYNESIINKNPYNIIHRIYTLEGELKYVEERCIHHIDKDDNVYRSVGTIHDITKQMQTQNELQLASKLFENSNDGVIITDENNKIVMINKKFTALTGYSIEEIKDKNPRFFSMGWGDEKFYKKMWHSIMHEGIWKGQIIDRTKYGQIYTADTTILCIKDDNDIITNYIGITKDISGEKEHEKEINKLAYYDSLTNLPNRVYFRENVKKFIKICEINNHKFAIMFIDIDNFKLVNDSLGHKIGNQMLIDITTKISDLITEDMIFSRMGGDEFAIFSKYDDITEIDTLASNIMQITKIPILLEGREITLGFSMGISLYPENGLNYGMLLQSVDTAMYQAKENGKNNFVYFNQEMNSSSMRKLDMNIQLNKALSNNSLTLLYQPKVSLQTKKIYGVEALLRWNDPLIGFISPDIFIPIAEESQLIEKIGYWVIERSLVEFKDVLMSTQNDLVISINISVKQLNDVDFVKNVSSIINKLNIDTKNIEFEITETAIMNDIETMIEQLNKIKSLGISISIDDFGTGQSSMKYLKRLPVNTIKIDKAFIADIGIDKEDRAITHAIVEISKKLHLKTVAEGVETHEHEKILYDMEVDNAQGYLYSKPLSIDSLKKLIILSNKVNKAPL